MTHAKPLGQEALLLPEMHASPGRQCEQAVTHTPLLMQIVPPPLARRALDKACRCWAGCRGTGGSRCRCSAPALLGAGPRFCWLRLSLSRGSRYRSNIARASCVAYRPPCTHRPSPLAGALSPTATALARPRSICRRDRVCPKVRTSPSNRSASIALLSIRCAGGTTTSACGTLRTDRVRHVRRRGAGDSRASTRRMGHGLRWLILRDNGRVSNGSDTGLLSAGLEHHRDRVADTPPLSANEIPCEVKLGGPTFRCSGSWGLLTAHAEAL